MTSLNSIRRLTNTIHKRQCHKPLYDLSIFDREVEIIDRFRYHKFYELGHKIGSIKFNPTTGQLLSIWVDKPFRRLHLGSSILKDANTYMSNKYFWAMSNRLEPFYLSQKNTQYVLRKDHGSNHYYYSYRFTV